MKQKVCSRRNDPENEACMVSEYQIGLLEMQTLENNRFFNAV